MVTGNIEKLEVITTDGNISEPFKNFKINPEIDFTLLEPSILSLQSLSTGIYSDTRITRVDSLNAMKEPEILNQTLINEEIEVYLTKELLKVIWKMKTGKTWKVPVIPYSGYFIVISFENFIRNQTAGTLSISTTTISTANTIDYITFRVTNNWIGTIDTSEATINFTIQNIVNNSRKALKIPLRIELQF